MKIFVYIAVILLPCFAFAAETAPAKESTNKAQGADVVKSGLKVPRFVSLKSKKANIRVGPGVDYPIKFVYQRENMPLEVIEEFGNWRKVRDIAGGEGWALHSLLSGRRFALTTQEAVLLNIYKGERAVLRLSKNMQIEVSECRRMQCEVKFEGTKGWVAKPSLWGVYADEVFD
jgi:SH3-like domain-containing protein